MPETRGIKGIITAAFLLLFMLPAFAQELPKQSVAEEQKPKEIFDLVIPASWGTIREVHKADPNRVIVHIQDAHCNYECQNKIADILDLLVREYDLKAAGIEGAWERLQTELFSTFPEDTIRYQASDYLLREGRLSGPEALVIQKGMEYPLELYGIEQQELYENNLSAFQTALPFKKDATGYFSLLSRHLGQLKDRLYNDELSRIDAGRLAFDLEVSNINEYILFLADKAAELKVNTKKYDNFTQLLKAVRLEDEIDFSLAEEERTELLTELIDVLEEDDLQVLLDKGNEYREERLSAARYLKFVKELGEKNEIDLTPYNNLNKYIRYAQSYEQVRNFELFNEIEDIDADLRSKVYTAEEQKKLDFLVRGLRVMERLVNIQMVNKDLEFYQDHQEGLKIDKFIEFITVQSGKYGYPVKLPSDIAYLDVYIPAWVNFYQVAGKRDEAMIKNSLGLLSQGNSRFAALITGGFHTRKLTEIMREEGVSYIVVTPLITSTEPGPYFDRLMGMPTLLDEMFAE